MTTRHEFAVTMHRDTNASHLGHKGRLAFFAIAENVSIERMRVRMLEEMLQPCGPPPTATLEHRADDGSAMDTD